VRPGPFPSLYLILGSLGRIFSVASNSRLMYAFSRDGAIPGSKYLRKVNRRWRSPNRCGSSPIEKKTIFQALTTCLLTPVWLLCTLSFMLALPDLGSSVAYNAVISIAGFGLYFSIGAQCIPTNAPPPGPLTKLS